MDFSRQRFTRGFCSGGRVVLVSSHKVPFAIWSHLRYKRTSQYAHMRRDSEALPRPRVGSVVLPRLLELSQDVPPYSNTLEGVELGDEGKTVSYSHMLIPTLNTSSQALRKHTVTEGILGTSPALAVGGVIAPVTTINEREVETNPEIPCQRVIYDPNNLDDPELISGKHKKLFQFSSYRVSVIDYAKPSALKRDINEKFKARYPGIDLTLSKLRSIKREMKKILVDECELDPGVLALAYVYFEKLVLYEKINKENRKLLAGVCLLLSAKLNDIKGAELQTLIKEIEDTFRESRKDLFSFEFPVLVALEFALHIPTQEVMPHYVRLMQS
ncbi:putative CDK5 and ABL1 enzyme substrate 2 isoform X2 [Apostichopus japonicus]|uniref:Putative CDK5 and ABL1 enzyme substrate 2 isoform X2 n=1 Tax=Stichopus japonicus TaxID=307972 RepID=A0A2G8KJJ0_STIJA|nr:putative CDK5 and ABL1 enzyme substrate 2 isoform X2 [Apostichopus japonicus]